MTEIETINSTLGAFKQRIEDLEKDFARLARESEGSRQARDTNRCTWWRGHAWGPWEDTVFNLVDVGYCVGGQVRRCTRCGKRKERW